MCKYTHAFSRSCRPHPTAKRGSRCGIKLENANKLITGLGGEKQRWSKTVEELQEQILLARRGSAGDLLVLSAKGSAEARM